jgi:hypothetical protein
MTGFCRLAIVFVSLAALSLVSLGAQTTSAEQPQFIRISEIRIKPDSMREWVDIQKTEAIPMEKKAGRPWRQVWSSGNEFFDRIVVEPIGSLADLDGQNMAVKVLGAEASAALHARIQRLVTGVRSTIATTRPDLGYGAMPAAPRLAILTIIDATNGHNRDFEDFMRTEVVPALKKGGAPWCSVVQIVYGDDANRYLAFVPIASYTELAKGSPLERALGAEGVRKLSDKSRAFVSRVERRLIRHLGDLSYSSAVSPSQ